MLRIFTNWTIPLVSLGLLVFGIMHVANNDTALPALEPPSTPPRVPWRDSLAASGIVEPRSENISIGSPLPGVVLEVFVAAEQTGTLVKRGQKLFRVDDRHLRAQLAVQQAQLKTPQAELLRLESLPRPEQVKPAEFAVAAATARLQAAQDAYQRATRLGIERAMAEAEVVEATQNKEFAEAELARAESELALILAGGWERDKAIVRAELQEIEARIAQIQTEIDRSLVCAPIDGIVLQVNVRPGEFVGTPPDEPLIVLGSTGSPCVRIDIDENDIPRFQPGLPARAVIRGSADRSLELEFVRVEPFVIPKRSLTGRNTERVDTRVLQVLYSIKGAGDDVFIGQQVDVFIETK